MSYIAVYGLAIGIPIFIVVFLTQAGLSGRINLPRKRRILKVRALPFARFEENVLNKALVELLKSAKVVFLIGNGLVLWNGNATISSNAGLGQGPCMTFSLRFLLLF